MSRRSLNFFHGTTSHIPERVLPAAELGHEGNYEDFYNDEPLRPNYAYAARTEGESWRYATHGDAMDAGRPRVYPVRPADFLTPKDARLKHPYEEPSAEMEEEYEDDPPDWGPKHSEYGPIQRVGNEIITSSARIMGAPKWAPPPGHVEGVSPHYRGMGPQGIHGVEQTLTGQTEETTPNWNAELPSGERVSDVLFHRAYTAGEAAKRGGTTEERLERLRAQGRVGQQFNKLNQGQLFDSNAYHRPRVEARKLPSRAIMRRMRMGPGPY